MNKVTFLHRVLPAFCGCLVSFLAITDTRADIVLADNLSAATGGTSTAIGDVQFAASFTTDSSNYTLSSVTLLLQRDTSDGVAELDLYGDGGLQPGSLLDTLGVTDGTSSSLTATSFSGGDFSLNSNTTYWIVLTALSGSFDWAWSTSNDGTGAGFLVGWSESDDAGGSWYTTENYPFQSQIMVNSIPEPTSILMIATAVPGIMAISSRRLRKRLFGKTPTN